MGAGGDDFDCPSNHGSRRPRIFDRVLGGNRIVGIDKHGKARCSRDQLVQEPDPLPSKLREQGDEAGGVAPRPVESGDKPGFDRVRAHAEDDLELSWSRTWPREPRSYSGVWQ